MYSELFLKFRRKKEKMLVGSFKPDIEYDDCKIRLFKKSDDTK
jgi:hypothetical protein